MASPTKPLTKISENDVIIKVALYNQCRTESKEMEFDLLANKNTLQ